MNWSSSGLVDELLGERHVVDEVEDVLSLLNVVSVSVRLVSAIFCVIYFFIEPPNKEKYNSERIQQQQKLNRIQIKEKEKKNNQFTVCIIIS